MAAWTAALTSLVPSACAPNAGASSWTALGSSGRVTTVDAAKTEEEMPDANTAASRLVRRRVCMIRVLGDTLQ